MKRVRLWLNLAAGLWLVAAILYFYPGRKDFLRVQPLEQGAPAGAEVLVVQDPAWEELFKQISVCIGRWQEDLPHGWAWRASEEDRSHVTALFFHPDEMPWAEAAGAWQPGSTNYLRLFGTSLPVWAVYHGAGTEREGREEWARFYKSRWTLPLAFAYPLRRYGWWLIALGFAALLMPWIIRWGHMVFRQSKLGEVPVPNTQKTVVKVWAGLTALALGICFLPGWVGLDMMRGGYALIVVSGFFALVGFIVVLMYSARAVQLDRLFSGAGLLAHWTYAPGEWAQFTEEEYRSERGEKLSLLKLVGVIMLVIGGGFALAMRDAASLVVLAVLGGVFLLCWLAAAGIPWLNRRRNRQRPGEVFISRQGAWISGAFHSWSLWGARLDAVEIPADAPGLLAITYSIPARHGRQEQILHIPIPAGRQKEAETVRAALAKMG